MTAYTTVAALTIFSCLIIGYHLAIVCRAWAFKRRTERERRVHEEHLKGLGWGR